MKNICHFNKPLLLVTLFASMLLFASCSDNQNSTDSKVIADKQNTAKFNTQKQVNDAQFIVIVASRNLEEIHLGRLAQLKGETAHVKDLGKMMEDVHTKSYEGLTELANSKQISIPSTATDDAKSTYNKLNKKSGKDFDKAYSNLMVNTHKKAVKDVKSATTESNDPDIKNWAIAALPDLRTHLAHSINCQEKCEQIPVQKLSNSQD